MKKREKMEMIKNVLSSIVIILFISVLFYAWLTTKPHGHYEPTETMQPDGSYYVWVED